MSIKNAWSDIENAAVCTLYFAMLALVLRGVKFNKRAMIRDAQHGTYAQAADDQHAARGLLPAGYPEAPKNGPLWARSRQSVEAKLMNCTAVHELLAPTAMSMSAHGYRPLTRFQGSLRDAMRTAYQLHAAQETTVALRAYNDSVAS